MKKALLYTTLGLLALTGCSSEEPLQPTGNYSVLRFEFPQGNNPFDEDIREIHDEYDVYLLYKDITDTDLNRQWQSLGTGKLLTGDPVPDEYVPFYVNFIKNHVFQYLSPDAVRAGLPVKIYMLENFGEVNTPGSGTGTGTGGTGTGGTGTRPNTSIVTTKTDGFDYWAISFTREGIEKNDPDAMRQARCQFIYQMILPQYESGKIVESQAIHNKLDFETSFSTDVNDPNYRLNRGFPHRVTDKFQFSTVTYYASQIHPSNSAYRVDYDYFLTWIRIGMFMPRAEIEEMYADYPLVLEIYNDVIDYMLDTYGIDLEGICKGPDNN
ncbi:MAG: hypothetical protein OSJ41_03215 [Duncaniella sp.]|nr:hypothetical protein [Duncaniella sp.]